MIKCEAIRNFTMCEFKKLKNIIRYNIDEHEDGHIYKNDIFECSEKTAKYLTGDNDNNTVVCKIIEIIPTK